MPRLPFRVAMFLSSYAPLFALLAYTNHETTWAFRILAGVAVISVILLVAVLASRLNDRGPRLVVAHSRPQDGDVLAYIATYLIPFFGLDLSHRHQAIAFAGFMLVLMVVYINSNMLFVNPLLSVAGYHSFEIEDPDGHTYALIAHRNDIVPGDTLQPSQITRYLRLEVRRDRSK
jgi:hypothetical protein